MEAIRAWFVPLWFHLLMRCLMRGAGSAANLSLLEESHLVSMIPHLSAFKTTGLVLSTRRMLLRVAAKPNKPVERAAPVPQTECVHPA